MAKARRPGRRAGEVWGVELPARPGAALRPHAGRCGLAVAGGVVDLDAGTPLFGGEHREVGAAEQLVRVTAEEAADPDADLERQSSGPDGGRFGERRG